MFAKNSRYKMLPESVVIDVKGRRLKEVNLRAMPDVTGTFYHTLEEGDRLDQLAYKYHKKPKRWWAIADANTEFLSPLDLIGKGAIKQIRIMLDCGEGAPQWSNLLKRFSAMVGVEDAKIEENVRVIEEEIETEWGMVSSGTDAYERSVVITFNSMNIGEEDLTSAVISSGFAVLEVQNIGRIGKKIIIPPQVTS